MSGLSFGQVVALCVIGMSASVLSAVGSSLIILSIFSRQRGSIRRNTVHQLLLGLSVSDLLFSLNLAISPFMLPKGVRDDAILAVGNKASCSASAFIFVLFRSSADMYNCFLALHFWLTMRKTQKRSHDSATSWFRLIAHGTSFLLGLCFSVAGLIMDKFKAHPFLGVCYFVPTKEVKGPLFEVEHWLRLLVLISVIVSIYCAISVACKVRSNLQKSQSSRMLMDRSTSLEGIMNDSSVTVSNNDVASSSRRSQTGDNTRQSGTTFWTTSMAGRQSVSLRAITSSRTRKQDVAYQAIWYTAVYINTIIWPIIAVVVINTTDAMAKKGDPGPFTLLVCLYLFMPLQGLLNFFVFIRPRYNRWKDYLERQQQVQQRVQRQQQQQQQNDNHIQPIAPPSCWNILKKAILEDFSSGQSRNRRRASIAPPDPSSSAGYPSLGINFTPCEEPDNPHSLGSTNTDGLPRIASNLLQKECNSSDDDSNIMKDDYGANSQPCIATNNNLPILCLPMDDLSAEEDDDDDFESNKKDPVHGTDETSDSSMEVQEKDSA